MKKILFVSLIFLFLCTSDAIAGKRYWISGAAAYWNNTANWSTTSGGAGGASVPGSSDTAYFDGNGVGNDTIDANVNVKRWEIAAGYTGTILQRTYTITIGTSGAVFSGGTFTGGSGNITVTGAFTISGTAFTSTSGTFSTNSNFTVSSGNFIHNSGKLSITASMTLTSSITGGTTFYNMDFVPTAANSTYTITSTTSITATGTVTIGGTKTSTFNTGTINMHGYLTTAGATAFGGGGTATFNFNGTGSQRITGNSTGGDGKLPHITVNKTSDTLKLFGVISTAGNWTYTAGNIQENTASVIMYGSPTISGGPTFYDVWLAPGGTFTVTGDTMIVKHLLAYGGGAAACPVINSGVISAEGNIDLSFQTQTSGTGGTGTLLINGTSNQTFTGSVSGSGRVCNVVIKKSSGTLTFASYIQAMKNWTYTSGTLSVGSSTIVFSDTKTITGSHSLGNVWFTGTASSTFTIASGTTLTITGTTDINGGTNLMNYDVGNIYLQGNININNTSTSGATGTATITINGSGKQTLTGGANFRAGEFTNLVINKSDTLVLSNIITIRSSYTYTAGVIVPGTSTMYFDGPSKRISGTHALYNVTFYGGNATTYTIPAGDTLTVQGTMSSSGGAAITLDSGIINVTGNISWPNIGTGGGGNATVLISGSGTQSFTGSGTAGTGLFPHIVIDKSSGTLSLASIISCTGNWTYVKGTVSPGTSSVALYGTFNLDGQGTSATMSFYRLQISTGTRTLTGNIDANDNFTISASATCVGGTYTINVGGNWNSQGTWTYNTSTVIFDGTNFNWIAGASGTTVNFANISVNRRSGKSVRLLNPIKVNTSMTLQLGRVKSDTTNFLEFADNATCTVNNDDSAYVHGPVRKTGNDAFSFPLGDTTLHDSIAYHPLAISAPGNASDRFEALYNATGQTLGSTVVDSLFDLSTCEKWSLERQFGTSNVLVTLSWNRNSCNTDVYGNMRVANWDGSGWADLGASSISVLYGGKGLVTGSGNPTYVSNVAYLTTAVAKNNYPTAVLHKKLDGGYYKAINGRLFFRFDEEYYDTGDLTFNIYDDEHTLVSSNSLMPAIAQPQVVYGDNRFHLNTVGCEITPSGPLADGFYILEVINDKNEKWYLRFEQDANIMIGNCPPPTEAE